MDAAYLRSVVAGAILILSSPAHGQPIDGDTLRMDGKTYRLFGLDAPELHQLCPDGWPAGRLAYARLQSLTAGKQLTCEARDRDRYGRTVAVCRANGADLGAAMVRLGMAWAYRRYSTAYVGQEAAARAEGLGVHAHGCIPAWQWRRENPR